MKTFTIEFLKTQHGSIEIQAKNQEDAITKYKKSKINWEDENVEILDNYEN